MSLLDRLLDWWHRPTTGRRGYRNGREQAEAWLSTQPSEETIRAHWDLTDPPLDEYDSGYQDVLRERGHEPKLPEWDTSRYLKGPLCPRLGWVTFTWADRMAQMRSAEAMARRMHEMVIEVGGTFGEGATCDEVMLTADQSARLDQLWLVEFGPIQSKP